MAHTSELTVPELKPPLQNTSAPRDKEPEGDLEKLRKWQEDRVTRKLRGEYESAVLHLSEVVNSNIDTHLRLASVRVEGAAHTRKSFLASLVHPYVHAEPLVLNNSTLGSVLQTSREIGHLLNETDIFASVVAKLEPSRDVFARPGDIDLVFQTKEKSRMYLKTTGEIGNNEGGAVSISLGMSQPSSQLT
ncbi:hypothetical protein EW026_g4663 [Hermanssonia centrifuga]|uniref:Uncharacterized protein n=1 Tax=Hermanssonia centrifuga TaxID=98765 RepID=A0A4S4KGF8_9APHY|nr:hypothetical protein EW026_g4663 [Hermanssonia centrifuga]